MSIDFRKFKIGTLLTVGVVSIIGLMVAATVYSNYLSSSALTIIRNSTTRIFDVLTIQRDMEELFSALGDVDMLRDEREIGDSNKKVGDLQNRAEETVVRGLDEKIFTEEEADRASRALQEVSEISGKIYKIKFSSAGILQEEIDQSDYGAFGKKELDNELNNLRNTRFKVLGVFHEITMRSDEEFNVAMEQVRRAQIVTWIVIGISLVLASFLAVFLVRSVKKIFDLKNEFVNIIAHDLRNPVTAIIGYLDIVTSKKDKRVVDLHDDFQALTVSAHKLRSQISNLLEVGRSEAGRLKINLEAVEPYEVIESSVIRAKALAEISGMKITYIKEKSNKVYVQADKSKLSDVMDNLMSNAIKYNKEKGTITVSTNDASENFSISVTDTGHGIPENKKDQIFKRYSRLETKETKSVGGTGLGLYTVKLSMDQMKGTVSFESKENVGTTFTVTLNKTNKKEAVEKDQVDS